MATSSANGDEESIDLSSPISEASRPESSRTSLLLPLSSQFSLSDVSLLSAADPHALRPRRRDHKGEAQEAREPRSAFPQIRISDPNPRLAQPHLISPGDARHDLTKRSPSRHRIQPLRQDGHRRGMDRRRIEVRERRDERDGSFSGAYDIQGYGEAYGEGP